MARITTVDYPRPFAPVKRGEHWFLDVEGQEVKLSNLTKTFWPKAGHTKGDLIAAYYNLAPFILPHLRDRPLTLRRMPDGAEGPEFYEKNAPAHTPDWVPRATIEGHGPRGVINFLMAQSTPSLCYVANLGCIEMHPMHSRQFHFGVPDYAFFDLDPFPPIEFATVRRVALMIKVALEQLGLTGYPKISGATGIVVYVPLDGSHSYEQARAFIERVCRLINRSWPEGTTMEWEIAKRAGKVFLDYAMVSEGRNIASVYSVRPTPTATVGVPVRWEELETDVQPADFDIRTVWKRLDEVGDLFAPMLVAGTPQGHNLNAAASTLGLDLSKLEAPPRQDVAPDPAALDEYARKRDFKVTAEPAGAVGRRRADVSTKDGTPLYMIHKHHARRLHYDLRLERGGVLVSFAVPRGLPEAPNERRLAVHVEDHPLEYGSFEGTIPKGEYGAGEARIFDTGTYETLEWTDSKITIRIHGERIQGEYHLVHSKQGGDPKNWLIFRSARDAPLARLPMAPITLAPMMATLTKEPFDAPCWVFEPKWDGVRTLAHIDQGATRLRSRRGRDVNEIYPELADLAVQLSGRNAVIDGEVIALDAAGKPSFEAIQQRFTLARATERALREYPVDFIAFDLLWLDGESLMELPLRERRALLERHVVPGKRLQISPQVSEHGTALYDSALAAGFEGIIAKKADSRYTPDRRSRDWLKVKFLKDQDCVIVGWSAGQGARGTSLGSLLIAVYRGDELSYVGHVGTGFTTKTLAMVKEMLDPLTTDEPAIPPPLKDEVDLRTVTWVRPELVCTVEYLTFTSQGRMRAASFKGIRPDKAPEDCVLEEPA